ncbi:hypothetical protein GALMADRAFT_915044 [Galerina marginata CBS 339.88]|uniref:Uncharacterized protein n=1 Tax=Galerina marginata (strain CBS 339.88) TaxID=685588 RepID=A0A067SQD8_GALM3|nr:hypothetical protein GALMADRAFT_915044 [Galerina marginata CBS 339.88]
MWAGAFGVRHLHSFLPTIRIPSAFNHTNPIATPCSLRRQCLPLMPFPPSPFSHDPPHSTFRDAERPASNTRAREFRQSPAPPHSHFQYHPSRLTGGVQAPAATLNFAYVRRRSPEQRVGNEYQRDAGCDGVGDERVGRMEEWSCGGGSCWRSCCILLLLCLKHSGCTAGLARVVLLLLGYLDDGGVAMAG